MCDSLAPSFWEFYPSSSQSPKTRCTLLHKPAKDQQCNWRMKDNPFREIERIGQSKFAITFNTFTMAAGWSHLANSIYALDCLDHTSSCAVHIFYHHNTHWPVEEASWHVMYLLMMWEALFFTIDWCSQLQMATITLHPYLMMIKETASSGTSVTDQLTSEGGVVRSVAKTPFVGFTFHPFKRTWPHGLMTYKFGEYHSNHSGWVHPYSEHAS